MIIRAEVGEKVESIVRSGFDSLTEDRDAKLPWAERKKAVIANLRQAPVETLTVAAADKLHNLRSTIEVHDEWQVSDRRCLSGGSMALIDTEPTDSQSLEITQEVATTELISSQLNPTHREAEHGLAVAPPGGTSPARSGAGTHQWRECLTWAGRQPGM